MAKYCLICFEEKNCLPKPVKKIYLPTPYTQKLVTEGIDIVTNFVIFFGIAASINIIVQKLILQPVRCVTRGRWGSGARALI